MPVLNRVADLAADIIAWRRDLHAHPELLYEVHRTAAFVASQLRAFGCEEVVTGLGRTGVVGILRGRQTRSGRAVAIRADMDALPIQEAGDRPHRSRHDGFMHACGHDGHTAMVLGAARYLAETRNFDGTAVFIFQPAEEGGAGGLAMVEDGLMDRFGIQEVFAIHNMPGIPEGHFALRSGPIMAAGDKFEITIEGRGGHAAKPHETIDPIVVGAALVQALQTIASRNIDPLDSCVVSVTQFHAGQSHNIIAPTAFLMGTIRTLNARLRDYAETRLREIVAGIATAHGASAPVQVKRGYPITINDDAATRFAAEVAGEIVGRDRVETETPPSMGGEDFSYMLQKRPGAMIFLGNGDSAGLHHPDYDFNDGIIPTGVSFWARLIERAMPVG
jgi:amidohydrolase